MTVFLSFSFLVFSFPFKFILLSFSQMKQDGNWTKIIMVKRTPYTQPWFLVNRKIIAWLKFLYRHYGVCLGQVGAKLVRWHFCSWSVTKRRNLWYSVTGYHFCISWENKTLMSSPLFPNFWHTDNSVQWPALFFLTHFTTSSPYSIFIYVISSTLPTDQ